MLRGSIPREETAMAFTDRHIADLRRDGFVVIDGLFDPEEIAAARAAAFREVAPPYARRDEPAGKNEFFPWADNALNRVPTHPRLIAALVRLTGTRELQLRTGYVMVKYSVNQYWQAFHCDYRNNTLGPELEQEEDDFQHLSCFVHLDDVDDGLAPILMVPNGRPDSEARRITGPAGTVCVYSMYTRHSASAFTGVGHRASMWVNVARKDRLWDWSIRFKAHTEPEMANMAKFIGAASPRQLEFIGFPAPGHPLWTPRYLAGMAKRYPGFDPRPYQVAESPLVAAASA
jgi:hypothetical protein